VTQLVKDQRDPKDIWNRYLAGLSFLEPVKNLDGFFQVYRTRFKPSWLLKGRAKLRASFNTIKVEPQTTDNLILKYRYVEGLKATKGVKLRPYKVWNKVEFIECLEHEGKPFTIRFE
jgi:hypothetical protein